MTGSFSTLSIALYQQAVTEIDEMLKQMAASIN